MYSSKFWLSVSFQVAQKASTILAPSRSLWKQRRETRARSCESQGLCNSEEPPAPPSSSCLLIWRRGGQKAKDLHCKHAPPVSFPGGWCRGRVGGGGGSSEVPIRSAIGSGHWVSGVGRGLPVLPLPPSCLRKLPEGSMGLETGHRGNERVF